MHLGLIAEHGVAVVEVEVSAAGVHALDDRALVVLDDVAEGFLGLGLDMVEVAEGDGRAIAGLDVAVVDGVAAADSGAVTADDRSGIVAADRHGAVAGRRGLVAKGEVAGLES